MLKKERNRINKLSLTVFKKKNDAFCFSGVCTKRISLSVRTSARKKVGVYKDIENQPTEAPHYEELTINGDGAQYTNTILH